MDFARLKQSDNLWPTLLHGDARDLLQEVPSDFFDAVLTDPPFAIGITNRETGRPKWDRSKIAFDPTFWAEVLRVVKPGGNLVSFGHSRTWARMSVAIEDAGFAIVDSLAWIHGQGYAAGAQKLDDELRRRGASDELVDAYSGFGTMLRPAFEPIVLARKLSTGESLSQVIAHGGVGGFNIDSSRIPSGAENRSRSPGSVSDTATWRIHRPEKRKSSPPPAGRMPSNVILQHSPDCSEDRCAAECPIALVRLQGTVNRGRNEDAARFYSVLHHPKATRNERPVTEGLSAAVVKPVGVMDWLVRLATKRGQLILDPFAGTGTTLEACSNQGVRSIGFELQPTQIVLANARLAKYKASTL